MIPVFGALGLLLSVAYGEAGAAATFFLFLAWCAYGNVPTKTDEEEAAEHHTYDPHEGLVEED